MSNIDEVKKKVEVGKNVYRMIRYDGSILDNPNIEGLEVIFQGSMGGVVEIFEGSVFKNTRIFSGGTGLVSIKKTNYKGIRNTTIKTVCPCYWKYVSIDEGCSIEQSNFMVVNDNDLVIKVGKDCMLSSDIFFRAADGHTIFDVHTGEVLNHATPIEIGDHVWVGAGVTFLKGAKVASNTIVGSKSLITKQFDEEFVAIGGTPAKILKHGVNWDRSRIFEYERMRNENSE